MSYQLGSELGRGGFGKVHRAFDMISQRVVAVKVMVKDEKNEASVRKMLIASEGEGNIYPRLDHPHIVRWLAAHGWGTPRVEISMELMDGTLASLVNSVCPSYPVPVHDILHQMLQALDYLFRHGYVHRDIKPENIFYTINTTSRFSSFSTSNALPHSPYHFRLGDFGLCTRDPQAALDPTATSPDAVGSFLFLAPELHLSAGVRQPQTHKADVWALYVTVLWILDVHQVRTQPRATLPPWWWGPWIDDIATRCGLYGRTTLLAGAVRKDVRLKGLEGMAKVEMRERASAGEMLGVLGRMKGVGGCETLGRTD